MGRSLISTALGISLFSAMFALQGCAATGSQGSDKEGGSRRNAIVNGEETTDFPATGMLLQQGQAFCTGTLIGPRTVLSAGHCMEGQSAGSFTFGIGSSESQIEAEIQVTAAVTHPQFDLQQLLNDVSVVTLAEDAPVSPMALNQSMDQSWVGKAVTLVGFGVTDGPSQTGSGTKRRVDVTIDSLDDKTLHYTTQQGKTACNGDSGGPAFADQGGQLVVAGITSYGDQNCQQYGVYTRVDAFLPFINEQLQNGGANGGQGGAAGGGDPNDPNGGQGGAAGGGDPNDPGNGGDPNDPGNGGQGGDPNDPGNGGQDGCQGETWEGRCDGNTVIWCDQDQVQQAQCQQCGFIPEEGVYDCIE